MIEAHTRGELSSLTIEAILIIEVILSSWSCWQQLKLRDLEYATTSVHSSGMDTNYPTSTPATTRLMFFIIAETKLPSFSNCSAQ